MDSYRLDVGIENVNEVYDGPGGILWEMLMGEEIHVGGTAETDILALEAGINRIAIPAEEAVKKAREMGLEIEFHKTCCSKSY